MPRTPQQRHRVVTIDHGWTGDKRTIQHVFTLRVHRKRSAAFGRGVIDSVTRVDRLRVAPNTIAILLRSSDQAATSSPSSTSSCRRRTGTAVGPTRYSRSSPRSTGSRSGAVIRKPKEQTEAFSPVGARALDERRLAKDEPGDHLGGCAALGVANWQIELDV
jgi:hypothetical protein